MYSEEYEDEELEKQNSGGFIKNFYYNNKVLVWIFIGIIAFIIIMSLLTGGGKSNSSNSNTGEYTVVINPTEETVAIGKSVNVIAYVQRDTKMDSTASSKITWSVEDETIAKVDNGNITGLNYGKTKVIATYIDSNNEKHSSGCNITVANGNPNLPLTNVSFKDGDLFMPLNQTYTIALKLEPALGYVENETFTSLNTNVATVDNNGVVTAVSEGETTIIFDVNNGVFRGELHVYVDRNYTRTEIIVTPSNISFDGELRKIKVGSSDTLSYTMTPQNADSSKLTWKSSDESVVTVDNFGNVKAISVGSARITAEAVNGVKDTIDIEVESDIVPVSDIILSISDISLTVGGQSQMITPVVIPDNASNKALNYTITDPSIASAMPNATGTQVTITAISVGSTTLVMRSAEGVEKTINIVVTGSNSGGNNGGGNNNNNSDDNKTIVVKSPSDNLSKDVNEALTKYAAGPTQLNVTLHSGISKITYCVTSNYNVECTPNLELNKSGQITIPNGGIYLLCVKKYDRNGYEVGSKPDVSNYYNGMLHYYINTTNGTNGNTGNSYRIVSGTVYDSETRAKTNPSKTNVTVVFSTASTSNVNGLKVCYNKSTSSTQKCSTTNNNQPIVLTFSENGLWIINLSNPVTSEKIATKYIYIDKNTTSTVTPTSAPVSCSQYSFAQCPTDRCYAWNNSCHATPDNTDPAQIRVTSATCTGCAAKIDVSANKSGKIQVSIVSGYDLVTKKSATCVRFGGGNSRYGQPYDYTKGNAALGIPFDRVGNNKCTATIKVDFTATDGTKDSVNYILDIN